MVTALGTMVELPNDHGTDWSDPRVAPFIWRDLQDGVQISHLGLEMYECCRGRASRYLAVKEW
jgi:hypothetical protein